jgi:hypothetical protein
MRLIAAFLLFFPTVVAHAAAAQLSGRVVDQDGKPLVAEVSIDGGAPKEGVRAICEWCCRECSRKVTTDKKGRFLLREVDPAMRYRLLAIAKGHDPAFVDADPDQSVTFSLRSRAAANPNRVVRGKVVDKDGKAIPGATVKSMVLRRRGIEAAENAAVELLAVTDGAGEFALRLRDSDARVDVRVSARDFAPVLAQNLETNTDHTITLGPGVTISGQLTHDNTRLPGIRIAYEHDAPGELESLGGGEIATDAEGRFILRGLAPDTPYHVFARMESLRPMASPMLSIRTNEGGTKQNIGVLEAFTGVRVAGFVKGVAGAVPEGTVLRLLRVRDVQTVPLNRDGSFAFEGVPLERVTILVRIPGYRAKRVGLTPAKNIENMMINVGR